jgi:hypothetical protein
MSRPLHDPHDTIIRKVLCYPATAMIHTSSVWNSEGAKRPGSIFTTVLDLRGTCGEYLGGMHTRLLTMDN